MTARTNTGEGRMQNSDYTITRLDQHIRPLKALVRIAGRRVGNPGTAGGKCAQLWVVTVGAGRGQRSPRPQDSSGGEGGSELAWTWS